MARIMRRSSRRSTIFMTTTCIIMMLKTNCCLLKNSTTTLPWNSKLSRHPLIATITHFVLIFPSFEKYSQDLDHAAKSSNNLRRTSKPSNLLRSISMSSANERTSNIRLFGDNRPVPSIFNRMTLANSHASQPRKRKFTISRTS